MLLIVAGLCLLTGGAAVASIVLRMQWLAIAGTLLVTGGLVSTGLFGRAECGLVIRKLHTFAISLMTRSKHADRTVRQQSMQLQGSRRWDEIWAVLTEFAERHGLCRLRLDLNLSWLHEGYHGDWRTLRQPDRVETWSICLPIISASRIVGKLEVAGRVSGSSSFQSMESLAALLQDLQPTVDRLFVEIEGDSHRKTHLDPWAAQVPVEVAMVNSLVDHPKTIS
jgi:UDP-GlcNAc:undecaprenyl-phosphate GlcNAc-1-phosphate transferase